MTLAKDYFITINTEIASDKEILEIYGKLMK